MEFRRYKTTPSSSVSLLRITRMYVLTDICRFYRYAVYICDLSTGIPFGTISILLGTLGPYALLYAKFPPGQILWKHFRHSHITNQTISDHLLLHSGCLTALGRISGKTRCLTRSDALGEWGVEWLIPNMTLPTAWGWTPCRINNCPIVEWLWCLRDGFCCFSLRGGKFPR
jgi:hypothetical protein